MSLRLLALFTVAMATSTSAVCAGAKGVLHTIEYGGEGTSRSTFGDMVFTLDAIGLPDARGPRLRVTVAARPAFKLQLAGESGNASATVKVVQLDGATPQIVFQHFTFGAHCCVVTKIATQVDGHWSAIAAGALDGDSGYDFEDIDGTGCTELISADQSFLYAFTGYANSQAPIRLQRLVGATLIDVTHDARYRAAVDASLKSMETQAGVGDVWHDNGFLAAWVATKALLGDGASAWKRMLATYDASSKWPMAFPTFPESLRAHLLAHDYIDDAGLYPLPSKLPKP